LEDSTPADPPVEQVKKFELIINLKTAKQIGVTIAQSGLEIIYLLIDVLHLGCKGLLQRLDGRFLSTHDLLRWPKLGL
jgi:hypothetical protein